MKFTTKMLLLLTFTLSLPGCAVSASRPLKTNEITWAKMGTPARIVDEQQVKVLVPDGQGGWTPGKGKLAGMVAIDESTLEYYRALDRKNPDQRKPTDSGSGASK